MCEWGFGVFVRGFKHGWVGAAVLPRTLLRGLDMQQTIIHGKGTGTLRGGIQQHFRKHPHVQSIRLGQFGEGESGVSIVTLK